VTGDPADGIQDTGIQSVPAEILGGHAHVARNLIHEGLTAFLNIVGGHGHGTEDGCCHAHCRHASTQGFHRSHQSAPAVFKYGSQIVVRSPQVPAPDL